jgi:hypothetical protein
MLDRPILKTKERPLGHKSFLPQEMVQQDVRIRVFKKGTIPNDDFPRRKVQLIIHLNERMQYTSQLQFVVQNYRDQDRVGIFVVFD